MLTTYRNLPLVGWISVLLLSLSASGSLAEPADDPAPFVMALASEPSESITMTWYVKVISEAFRRLDIDLRLEVYPPSRASRLLDNGVVDGEGLRPVGYEDRHPAAVRVDELMFTVIFAAAVTRSDIELQSLNDLKDKNYRVEYVRGTEPLDEMLSAVVNQGHLSPISEAGHGLRKLAAGRSEVFIDFPGRIEALAAAPDMKSAGIRVIILPEQVNIYPYLHARHAELAPRLARVLRDIREEGLFEDYMALAHKELAGD